MEFYEMFKYIKKDTNLFEASLNPDEQEVANFSKQYGFGSIQWQNAMIARIKRKLKSGEQFTSLDNLFIETQAMHNKALLDELRAAGLPQGFNVN